ncbi:NHS-like protein 3 [Leptodactylus fuscus]|uniref:NHS-like protein 3 n=1 Tax=Leptodactylus fuscus TaxID=238119 RepID=UPI003F4E959B
MSTQTALIPDHDPALPGPDAAASEPKKKKHKPGTLRRALSWLRGRKKKKSEVKQQEGKDFAKPDGEPQPTPLQDDDSSGNLFFPSGRTSVVEDIHSQAQEGLKSLQRREKQHSKHSFQDENKPPEPTPETADNGFRTRSLSYSTENTDDALSTRSEMIQRKGSTFRPYDSPRTPSNMIGRKRKEKRATVVGVPQHIAAELGLHPSSVRRGIHDVFRREDGQLVGKKSADIPVENGVQRQKEEFVVIPTVDGKPASVAHSGAHISLAALEQTEAALQRHIEKVYHDDSCIGRKSSSKLSPLVLRPKSLAVPGMTTHSPQSDPVSPVMSISPQGTYMSKIIPNAVLPPLVDVVALSRSSVRTLSRCSLASASPASIRGSLHRGRGMSSSSDNWSRSQSTETIVSDSSTISSRGGDNALEGNEKSGLSTGRASPAPSTGTQDGSDAASLCSGRSSVRSVSLRKSKKAPPPPKRTYSLQQQKELGLPPRPEKKSSTKTNKDPWVLRAEKVSSDDVFLPPLAGPKQNSPSRSDRTMSPSSGYSSQSETPTMPVKSLLESPGSRRKTPPKPERSSLKSAANISVTSTSSVENNSPVLVSSSRVGSSMGDQERQDSIPPHPNVPAPLCPPPISVGDFVVAAVTPPPSPPPSHHPTPPPARKSESDADTAPSVKEEKAQKESLWPPPPPESSDVQDLSMADFPPPDEELFLPPPPAVEPVTELASSEPVSVSSNNKSDVLKAEIPVSTSNSQENESVVAAPQPESVPLNLTKPSDTAEHVIKNNSDPVPPVADKNTDSIVPPSTEPMVVPPASSDTSLTNGEALIAYKPHFNTTPMTSSEPKEPLDVTVPQESTGNISLTNMEPKNTTTVSVTTVPSAAVQTTVPNVPSSVAVTSSLLSKAISSPHPKANTWKPVSAPGSKKESATSQSLVAAQKEEANLPIVTPSLLQMVRLRSIQARVPQSPFSPPPSGLPAPQKPVRKSLSQRSSQGSDSSPVESPTGPPVSLQKPPESPSAHRSPASAASFVFARGSKKFVFDPPASQDSESSLKADMVVELKAHGGPRSPDEKPPIQRKPSKIPPPVARKPSVGIPRTPTTPPVSTGSTNGNVFTARDPGLAPSTSASIASEVQAGHDQPQKSQMEQA